MAENESGTANVTIRETDPATQQISQVPQQFVNDAWDELENTHLVSLAATAALSKEVFSWNSLEDAYELINLRKHFNTFDNSYWEFNATVLMLILAHYGEL